MFKKNIDDRYTINSDDFQRVNASETTMTNRKSYKRIKTSDERQKTLRNTDLRDVAESFLKNAGDERQIFLKYCKEIINESGCDDLKVWFKFR